VISLSELKTLQAHREYPSVSILLPTHRYAPANKQDKIKASNLIKKAIDRLHDEFPKREVAAVVKNLLGLARHVDWKHMLEDWRCMLPAPKLWRSACRSRSNPVR
jgi:hypothetical protein